MKSMMNIDGTNIELVQDKKIVQNWRGEEDCWPKEHYSKLTITFEKDTNDGTSATLLQEEVPEDCAESFDKGWYEFYWKILCRNCLKNNCKSIQPYSASPYKCMTGNREFDKKTR